MQSLINFIEDSAESMYSVQVVFNGFLNLYDSILKEYYSRPKSRSKMTPQLNKTQRDVEDIFHYCIIWTFGMILKPSCRQGLQRHMAEMFRIKNSTSKISDILSKEDDDVDIFGLQLDFSSCCWSKAIKDSPENTVSNIILRQRKEMIKLLIKHEKRVLLTGPLATGKTKLANSILNSICQENGTTTGMTLSCLVRGDLLNFAHRMRKVLVKNDNDRYKPVNSGNLILFVDDLHMSPSEPESEIRPFWELIRSFLDHKGYWSTPENYRVIDKVILMAAMDSSVGSKGSYIDKIMRHFSIVCIDEWDYFQEQCSNYLNNHLKLISLSKFENRLLHPSNIRMTAKAALELLISLKNHMIASYEKPLHVFTSHHLECIYREFLMAESHELHGLENFIDFWTYNCNKHFKNRLCYADVEVYEDIFYRVSCKTLDINDPMILGRLKRGTLSESFIMKIKAKVEKKISEQKDDSNLISKIHHFNLEDLSIFPEFTSHLLSLNDILSQQMDSHAIFGYSPDTSTSLDIIHSAVNIRGLTLHEFTCLESDVKKKWTSFIRKHLYEILSVDRKCVLLINIFPNVKLSPEFYAEIHSLMDGAKANLWWTSKEYEELKSMMATQMILKVKSTKIDSEIDKSADDKLSRFCNEFEIADFWSLKVRSNLSIIIRFDTRDSHNLKMLSIFPRLVSGSQSFLLKAYNLAELKSIAINLYSKFLRNTEWENKVTELSEISSELFYFSTQSKSALPLKILEYVESLKLTCSTLTNVKNELDNQINLQTATNRQLSIVKQKMFETVEDEKKYLAFLPDELSRILRELAELKISMEKNNEDIFDLKNAINKRIENEIRLANEAEEIRVQGLFAEVTAILENGIKSLYTIKKNHLEELKTHVSPPADLAIVAQCLCILFDTRHMIWATARKLLSSHTFLEKCYNYDPKNICQAKVEKLQKCFDSPVFVNSNTSKSAPAIKSLWIWLKSLVKYAKFLIVRRAEVEEAKVKFQPPGATLDETESMNKLNNDAANMKARNNALLIQKQEAVGRLALLGEVFSSESIFSKAKPDPTVFFD